MTPDFIHSLVCPKCRGHVTSSNELHESGRIKSADINCLACGKVFEVIDFIVIASGQLSLQKSSIREFWSSHPCMGKWENDEVQFSGLREYRYRTHPWFNEVAEFANHKDERVVEIGCSQAIDMTEFLTAGVQSYIGVDLSWESLRIASRRLSYYNLFTEKVNLLCVDAEILPLKSEIVDYLYSYGVIHHSENTPNIIAHIKRILAPGGRFAVMYYYKYSLTNLIEIAGRTLNKTLVFLSRDKNIFQKICKLIPFRPAVGHYRNFLNTGYSAILHAPYAHTFSKSESRKMFAGLELDSLKLYQLSPFLRAITDKLFGYPFSYWLGKFVGWDLVIKGHQSGLRKLAPLSTSNEQVVPMLKTNHVPQKPVVPM